MAKSRTDRQRRASRSRSGASLRESRVGGALAFGLAVLTVAVAVGGISGGHFNPAVTVGTACARRTPWRHVPGLVAQLGGGTLTAAVLFVIAVGRPGSDATSSGSTSNGYGPRSPDRCDLGSVAVAFSTGPAALGQVWVFLVAPTVGAALAGLLFRAITGLRYGLGGQGAQRFTS